MLYLAESHENILLANCLYIHIYIILCRVPLGLLQNGRFQHISPVVIGGLSAACLCVVIDGSRDHTNKKRTYSSNDTM